MYTYSYTLYNTEKSFINYINFFYKLIFLFSINLTFIFYLILPHFNIIMIIISYCKDLFKIQSKLNVNYMQFYINKYKK